jgi:hypothetical protein
VLLASTAAVSPVNSSVGVPTLVGVAVGWIASSTRHTFDLFRRETHAQADDCSCSRRVGGRVELERRVD